MTFWYIEFKLKSEKSKSKRSSIEPHAQIGRSFLVKVK